MYDATLGDKELIDQMYEQMKQEQSAKARKMTREQEEDAEKERRPPRRGYSREVEAIYDLTDNIVALRAETGRWSPSHAAKAMTRRPWFPGEAAEHKMRKRARDKVNSAIAAAQQRWRQAHDPPVGP
jgi:hypothetical protein